MKYLCIAVGKKHDSDLKASIEEFEKRLSGYVSFEWNIIPSKDKDSESVSIAKIIKDGDVVILLDEHGEPFTNNKLAEVLDRISGSGIKRIVFIIGGAYGVSDELKHRANIIWSLSPLVFPHMIVRLLLVEQLYRTHNTLSGGKYHHE